MPQESIMTATSAAGISTGAALRRDTPAGIIQRDYWKRLQISYYANIALIDDEVGKILEAVKNVMAKMRLWILPPIMEKCWETMVSGET